MTTIYNNTQADDNWIKSLPGYRDELILESKDDTEVSEYSLGQDLEAIKAEYRANLFQTMWDYIDSTRPLTSFRNRFYRNVNESFTMSFYAGWADGGGSGPLPDELNN